MKFCGFIWAPAFNFYQDIIHDIHQIYDVEGYSIYNFEEKTYESTVLEVYTTDDISPLTVKNVKLPAMKMYSPRFVYFTFELPDPKYRQKGTGTLISTAIENIKKEIRTKFKTRINGYTHDIIIHMSDNTDQTQQISEIMKKYDSYKTHEFIQTKLFLRKQFHNGEFHRMDILVRRNAIRTGNFELYNLMQVTRGAKYDAVKQFKELISSLDNNSFDENKSKIFYKGDYLLADGSHRLSYAYHYNVSFVPVLRNEQMIVTGFGNYNLMWFITHGFSSDQIQIIKDEFEYLVEYLS